MLRYSVVVFCLLAFVALAAQKNRPTVCILGGTPSSAKIIDEIPDDLKSKYNFISFNRPGYGGTPNDSLTEQKLFALAAKAGLRKNDFAIIGVSGGGPLAILIARKFHLKHCGVISGMVPAKEYFAYADSTFTKSLMQSVVAGFGEFKTTIEKFPNVEEILKQANSPLPAAIRASFDDLNFVLRQTGFNKKTYKKLNLDWLHGENDKNVALESVQLFLSNFKKAELTIIPNADHAIDGRILTRQMLEKWAFDDH